MLLGIDVSTWFEVLEHGAAYYSGDTPMDPLDAFRENGVDCIRIRLWNHPYSEDGTPYLGGTCDLDNFLRLARLAGEKGFRVMLDFHYSDFWADPNKQFLPKAWTGLGEEELEQKVYSFTRETLETIRANGIELPFIQVGNEITNGLLWPVGKLDESTSPRGNYPTFIRLLKAGIRACREVYPAARLILHLERSHDGAVYQEFFSEMEQAGVDYDIIGTSYYPYWHGTFEQFFANMDACARFGKPRMIVETAYAFTLEDYLDDGKPGLVIRRDNVETLGAFLPYPLTPQGQADFVEKLLELSAAHNIAGIFYWEPLWVPGEGICWASEEGERYIREEGKPTRNEWANQCLFDYDRRKLPAFDRFRT